MDSESSGLTVMPPVLVIVLRRGVEAHHQTNLFTINDSYGIGRHFSFKVLNICSVFLP